MCLLMVLVLGWGGTGCRSAYRQTRKTYPADPCARLGLRIGEAQQAEKQAGQAATRLRDQLAKGLGRQDLEPDVDRLEVATLEFRRRMATVHDAAATCDQDPRFTGEIKRLETRSTRMLETIKLIRTNGVNPSVAQLDNFLRAAVAP